MEVPPLRYGLENISKKEYPHRDLSAALRSGRDDKGEDSASREEQLPNGSRVQQLLFLGNVLLAEVCLADVFAPVFQVFL
jgi:hypothetical protein